MSSYGEMYSEREKENNAPDTIYIEYETIDVAGCCGLISFCIINSNVKGKWSKETIYSNLIFKLLETVAEHTHGTKALHKVLHYVLTTRVRDREQAKSDMPVNMTKFHSFISNYITPKALGKPIKSPRTRNTNQLHSVQVSDLKRILKILKNRGT